MTWLRKQKIALKTLILTQSCAFFLTFANADVTDNALDLAYSLQIDAIKSQVKYETLQESYDLRLKQLESENQRYFWIMIAGTVAMGYALGNNR